MLFALHIKNIALIDDATIEFKNGLNVLTGETGAGKSILIGSINLLLGDRANRELIRQDAERAEVGGIFYLETEAERKALSELGYEPDDDGAVSLSRTLLRDGKNLCRICGQAATLSELKAVGSLLVNIHGQHDSQTLLSPASHIHFLDGFLKEEGKIALDAYKAAYKEWQALLNEAESLDMDEAERLRKIDMLSFESEEIRSAALAPGEEEELKARRDMILNKKRLEESVATALSALCDADDGPDARQSLSVAAENLADAAGYDATLAELADKAQALTEEADLLARGLRNYFERLAGDEQPIDEIEARLDVIYRLKRKYGATVEAVIAYGEACEKELKQLENAEVQKENLLKEVAEAEHKAQTLAAGLSALRQRAICDIEEKISETLHFLNMPDAEFSIILTEIPLSANGKEQVGFFIKTNAGEEFRPLHKIVSGGELSRIMLAIKSVLTDGDPAETLIFDEIDTGVSGSAAQKIGRKLRDLSAGKQVLCVTHLAQIAAMATTHFLIEKTSADGRTQTQITPLDYESRITELARIISGDAASDTTRRQAEELIRFGDKHDS